MLPVNDNGGGSARIRVMVAGPGQESVLYQMQPPFVNDARFFVTGYAVTWELLVASLPQQKPEILIVQGGIAPGIDSLKSLLLGLQAWNGTAVVILPDSMAINQGVFQAMSGVVSATLVAPINWADLPSQAYSWAQTARAKTIQVAPALAASFGGSGVLQTGVITPTLTGTKRIAVLSQAGGAGASTVAESLAYELSARLSVRTLLFSLGLPPAAACHFKLRYIPNLGEFFDRPGKPAIQSAIQNFEGLDFLLAPENSREYMSAAAGSQDLRAPKSIYSMFRDAEDGSYAAMVMDAPGAESAWQAYSLMFANTIVLVARPTLSDLFVTLHTVNLLLAGLGEHQFARDSIFLVINQASEYSAYTPSGFQSELVQAAGWAPKILAVIEHDPAVVAAQDARVPVTLRSEKLGKGIRQMVTTLFPGMDRGGGQPTSQGQERALFKLPKFKLG